MLPLLLEWAGVTLGVFLVGLVGGCSGCVLGLARPLWLLVRRLKPKAENRSQPLVLVQVPQSYILARTNPTAPARSPFAAISKPAYFDHKSISCPLIHMTRQIHNPKRKSCFFEFRDSQPSSSCINPSTLPYQPQFHATYQTAYLSNAFHFATLSLPYTCFCNTHTHMKVFFFL